MHTARRSGVGYLDAKRDRAGMLGRTGRCAVDAMDHPGCRTPGKRCCYDDRGGIGRRVVGGRQRGDLLRCLGCTADGGRRRGAAGKRPNAVLRRGCGVGREGRSCGKALDAAGCTGQRRKHQQESQREGELCAPLHLVQCSCLNILLGVTVGRGGAITERWSKRAARSPASRPGCAG